MHIGFIQNIMGLCKKPRFCYLAACAANNYFEWGLCKKSFAAFGGKRKF